MVHHRGYHVTRWVKILVIVSALDETCKDRWGNVGKDCGNKDYKENKVMLAGNHQLRNLIVIMHLPWKGASRTDHRGRISPWYRAPSQAWSDHTPTHSRGSRRCLWSTSACGRPRRDCRRGRSSSRGQRLRSGHLPHPRSPHTPEFCWWSKQWLKIKLSSFTTREHYELYDCEFCNLTWVVVWLFHI